MDFKAICFQFTNDATVEGAIKVTHRKLGNSSIQSRSFFKFNKLDLGKIRGRYKLSKKNIPRKGEWYILLLNEKQEG